MITNQKITSADLKNSDLAQLYKDLDSCPEGSSNQEAVCRSHL